jgi:kynurenine 3-monooxygenase
MSKKPILIIGAGLSGALLAIRLAQKGFRVAVYEKRPDMRKTTISAGRSINLALSDRGIRALKLVGLEKEMIQLSIPMHGRMIHKTGFEPRLFPYSGRTGEHINSVSRGDLNIALLNKAETYESVELHFNCECTYVNLNEAEAFFKNSSQETFSVRGEVVIGTDGAGSALRDSMKAELPGFQITQEFLNHGYKELNLPAAAGNHFQIEKNALHIWPRESFMLIALPNLAGDFTVTLFLSHLGAENSFEALKNAGETEQFFQKQFPDIVPLIPDLADQFAPYGTGHLLGTVKCYPWQAHGKCLLLGDAAHAIVPFYGQGMNCSFEDVVVLDELIETHGPRWPLVFDAFQQSRKENTDAIADLAIDNFYEMRDRTADVVFGRKKNLENLLEAGHPEFFSKYSLVTFREDVPYKQAMEQGRKQDEILMKICAEQEDITSLNLKEVLAKINV